MNDTITINADGLNVIAAEFGATAKQVEPAMRRAMVRVTRWAGNEVRRRVAKSAKITGSVVKGRTIVNLNRDRGRIWIGLSAIDLKRLKPRQTKAGVTAGPARRPGAFIANKLGGHVFERAGKERLPIKKSEGVEIREHGEEALAAIATELEERLLREFERELKWQTRSK